MMDFLMVSTSEMRPVLLAIFTQSPCNLELPRRRTVCTASLGIGGIFASVYRALLYLLLIDRKISKSRRLHNQLELAVLGSSGP
jgi:hypothetical protein